MSKCSKVVVKTITTLFALTLLCIALHNMYCRFEPGKELPIATLLVAGCFLLLVVWFNVKGFEFAGIKFSLAEEVKEIAERQLKNRVVIEKKSGIPFFVDEYGKAHELVDIATTQFLAAGNGIINDEMRGIEKGKAYPSIKDARVFINNEDYFIEYNNILYYQRGLAWIYKLAQLINIEKDAKTKPGAWKKNGQPWVKELSFDELDSKIEVRNM